MHDDGAGDQGDAEENRSISVLEGLQERGWEPGLSEKSYQNIIGAGLRSKNLPLAFVAAQLAFEERPVTLRGLTYRVVSAGWLPGTDKVHYRRLGSVMTTLREKGLIPFHWIVDNIRSTEKPSSWSGLADFAETVKRTYRKDFWAALPDYVHIIVEKDAIAGVLAPVTREYDVALSPIRGYVSLSFAHEIAETWNKIAKPIFCFYLGDFDASGFDLERNIRRQADEVLHPAFPVGSPRRERRRLRRLRPDPPQAQKAGHPLQAVPGQARGPVRRTGRHTRAELRGRVKDGITAHIDAERWQRLQQTEQLERETLEHLAAGWQVAPGRLPPLVRLNNEQRAEREVQAGCRGQTRWLPSRDLAPPRPEMPLARLRSKSPVGRGG